MGCSCLKCGGAGYFFRHSNPCNDCKETGQMAEVTQWGTIIFQDVEYPVGTVFEYLNTRSNIGRGKYVRLLTPKRLEQTIEVVPLKEVWMWLENVETGKEKPYPFWKVIPLSIRGFVQESAVSVESKFKKDKN